jgi:2-keto-4-pentenoate hydratase/2-oxohepta-3-ene-1,7-dioic acid hydratase in catechol pathway
LDYVAGYSVALDMTVRGSEDRSFRKSLDTYAVLGPWLVTRDEVPDPGRLDLWLKVNGQSRQKTNTSLLIYDVPKLIEYASAFYTLHPGDIIMTGTPEGVGPVLPGDVIEVGIQSIGTMQVNVVAKS